MSKVLVVDAATETGSAIAREFSRQGHQVHALIRPVVTNSGRKIDQNEVKQIIRDLAREEVVPISGDIQRSDDQIHSLVSRVDVIVDAAAESQDAEKASRALIQAVQESSRQNQRRPVLIYASNIWIQGKSDNLVTEEDRPNPPTSGRWRVQHEQTILRENNEWRGVVIRAGQIYGQSGSQTHEWFEGARNNRLVAYGNPQNRIPTIHIEDLARAYVRAAERADLQQPQNRIYLVANPATESLAEMLGAVRRVTGSKDEPKYQSPKDAHSESQAVSIRSISTRRANIQLEWRAMKPSFVDGSQLYHQSWAANAEQKSN